MLALRNFTDWESLGLALGLKKHTLRMIRFQKRECTDKCKMKMLAAWLCQRDNVPQKGVPSWSVLRATLRKIGENVVADSIEVS